MFNSEILVILKCLVTERPLREDGELLVAFFSPSITRARELKSGGLLPHDPKGTKYVNSVLFTRMVVALCKDLLLNEQSDNLASIYVIKEQSF